MQCASVAIQAAGRSAATRRNMRAVQRSVRKLQALRRGKAQRRRLRREHEAASLIQRHVRAAIAHRDAFDPYAQARTDPCQLQ